MVGCSPSGKGSPFTSRNLSLSSTKLLRVKFVPSHFLNTFKLVSTSNHDTWPQRHHWREVLLAKIIITGYQWRSEGWSSLLKQLITSRSYFLHMLSTQNHHGDLASYQWSQSELTAHYVTLVIIKLGTSHSQIQYQSTFNIFIVKRKVTKWILIPTF